MIFHETDLVRMFPKDWIKECFVGDFKFVGYEVPLKWDRHGRHEVTDMLYESEDGKTSIVVEAKVKATMHVLPQLFKYRATLLKDHEDVISIILANEVSQDLYEFVGYVQDVLDLYLIQLDGDGKHWRFVQYD